MLVDGLKIEEIEPVLYQFVQNTLDRNQKAAAVLRKGAEIAPAMGLIGTLIGLVQMLGQLEDPSAIGAPMAVALLTTLYGALLSFMLLTPLASKIERNSDEELIINKIFLTTVISIGKLESPRKLQNLLNVILPPEQRLNIYK
jgi:chemotaxis protein MotA